MYVLNYTYQNVRFKMYVSNYKFQTIIIEFISNQKKRFTSYKLYSYRGRVRLLCDA